MSEKKNVNRIVNAEWSLLNLNLYTRFWLIIKSSFFSRWDWDVSVYHTPATNWITLLQIWQITLKSLTGGVEQSARRFHSSAASCRRSSVCWAYGYLLTGVPWGESTSWLACILGYLDWASGWLCLGLMSWLRQRCGSHRLQAPSKSLARR